MQYAPRAQQVGEENLPYSIRKENTMCKLRQWVKDLPDVIHVTKKEYFLTVAVSFCFGVILGFVFAPKRTKYSTIGSHNGNGNMGIGNVVEDEEEQMED